MDVEPDTKPRVDPTPVQSALSPQPPSAIPPAPKRLGRRLIAGIVAGVLVLLVSSGALAYAFVYQNPDRVVHEALLKLLQSETMSGSGTANIEGEGFTVDIDFDGKAATKLLEFNSTAIVAVEIGDESQSFTVDASSKTVDDTTYIKLTGLKDAADELAAQYGDPSLSYASTIIEEIDDKWIRIRAADLEGFLGTSSADQECSTKVWEGLRTNSDDTNELVNLYKKNKVIGVNKTLGSKDINGTVSLGYAVTYDQSAATKFIRGVDSTKFGRDLKACDDSIDFNEIAEDISSNKTNENVTVSTELWISRFGHEITEFSLNIKGDDENENGNVVFRPNFASEVKVEAPQNSVPVTTIMESIQSLFMESLMDASSQPNTLSDEELQALIESRT